MGPLAFLHRDNMYYVTGAIDFVTAPAWLYASRALFVAQQGQTLTLNFSELAMSTNSAALALMIEWIKLASAHQVTLRFVSFPASLLSIAKASGMMDLLRDYLS